MPTIAAFPAASRCPPGSRCARSWPCCFPHLLLPQQLPPPAPRGEGRPGPSQRCPRSVGTHISSGAGAPSRRVPAAQGAPQAASPQQQHQGQEQQRRTHRDPSSATAVLGVFLGDGRQGVSLPTAKPACHLWKREQCLWPKGKVTRSEGRAWFDSCWP